MKSSAAMIIISVAASVAFVPVVFAAGARSIEGITLGSSYDAARIQLSKKFAITDVTFSAPGVEYFVALSKDTMERFAVAGGFGKVIYIEHDKIFSAGQELLVPPVLELARTAYHAPSAIYEEIQSSKFYAQWGLDVSGTNAINSCQYITFTPVPSNATQNENLFGYTQMPTNAYGDCPEYVGLELGLDHNDSKLVQGTRLELFDELGMKTAISQAQTNSANAAAQRENNASQNKPSF